MAAKELVIVTGGSGFIGSAVINRLAGRYALAGFDRIAKQVPPAEAECICIDLTSEPAVKAAFDRVRIAYGRRIASVVHLAAYYDLSGEPSSLYEEITLGGTERLLRHLQEFDVGQFVFASSMLVHAPVEPGKLIREDSPLEPRWPYPMSKIQAEALIGEKRGGIPAVLLRMAGVYDDLCHSAFLSQQIARIYERQLLGRFYPGDAQRGQSYVHLDDATEAILRLIDKRKELPEELPLLLGEPRVLSYAEIQEHAGEVLHGQKWQTREIPKALAKTGAWVENEVLQEDAFIKPWMVDSANDYYALDTSRARELLGWEPKHFLGDSLAVMLSALKSDPVAWYRENKLNTALVEAESAGEPRQRAAHAHSTSDELLTEHRRMSEHEKMMTAERRSTLWAHFVNLALGVWLLTSPTVLGLFEPGAFGDGVLRVTAERGLASPEWRTAALAWSDIASGALIVVFALLSLNRRTNWAQWANTAVGLWLLFAPLVFWSPSAAAYLNDTLVGALVIAFSVLIPMMPGMSHEAMMGGGAVPPGWSYCPSTWAQRLPIIALGLFGFLIARYLAAYQMGHVDSIWDPFFPGLAAGRNGTESIITSDVSKAWPVPDAGLGAVAYMLEVLMGAMGDKRRWRTMPWMVTFFGILVVPLGVVSIYFIVIQPIQIGTWCALCLLAAAAMLAMIPFALDELVAMGQYLRATHRSGRSTWRAFFMGGGALPGSKEYKQIDFASVHGAFAAMARGVTVPWPLVASALLGVWLMFTRLALGSEPPLANGDHLVGALVVTISIIAMAEVARPLRFLNALCGAWLIAAPWLLEGGSVVANSAAALAGLALVALSLPRGRLGAQHYGRWDRLIV